MTSRPKAPKMAKPPQDHLERDDEYRWRMAVEHPLRYPLDPEQDAHIIRRKLFWFALWRRLGEWTGWWWPFLAWADRQGLLDRAAVSRADLIRRQGNLVRNYKPGPSAPSRK